MNDTPLKGTPKLGERDRLILELIDEASREVRWMRDADCHLEAFDSASWKTTQHLAHNLAARANALNLAVLARGAQELEQFASKVLGNSRADRPSDVYAAQVAIELIEIELDTLKMEFGAG